MKEKEKKPVQIVTERRDKNEERERENERMIVNSMALQLELALAICKMKHNGARYVCVRICWAIYSVHCLHKTHACKIRTVKLRFSIITQTRQNVKLP